MEKLKVFFVNSLRNSPCVLEKLLNDMNSQLILTSANSLKALDCSINTSLPDLVFAAVTFEGTSGFDLIRDFKNKYPPVKLIAYSQKDDFLNICHMITAGASAYLGCDVKKEEIIEAITVVMDGRTYIQKSIISKLSKYHTNGQDKSMNFLSAREIQVVKLITRDFTSMAVGKILFISGHTVETHRKNIFRKTGVKSISELINFAKENHII